MPKLTGLEVEIAAEYAQDRYCAGSNDDVELVLPYVVEPTENGTWVLTRVWVPKHVYEADDDSN